MQSLEDRLEELSCVSERQTTQHAKPISIDAPIKYRGASTSPSIGTQIHTHRKWLFAGALVCALVYYNKTTHHNLRTTKRGGTSDEDDDPLFQPL